MIGSIILRKIRSGSHLEHLGIKSRNFYKSSTLIIPSPFLSNLSQALLILVRSAEDKLYSWKSYDSSKPFKITATKRLMKMIPNIH